MRKWILFLALMACVATVGRTQQEPIPPGLVEARKSLGKHTVDPPVLMPRLQFDPVEWRREAEELARLAGQLTADADQISNGRIPKDLPNKLKRIEKLAKGLRREVAP